MFFGRRHGGDGLAHKLFDCIIVWGLWALPLFPKRLDSMTRYLLALFVLSLTVALGCGGGVKEPTGPPPAPTPLTMEEWKTLPIVDKYDEGTYERIRMQYPELQNEQAWYDYMMREIMPQRNIDIPVAPGAIPAAAPAGIVEQ